MGVNIRSSRLLTSHRYPAAPCDPVLDKQEQKEDGWMFAVVCAKREHDAAVNHRGRARQVRAPFFFLGALNHHRTISHRSSPGPATFHLVSIYHAGVRRLLLLNKNTHLYIRDKIL